MILREVQKQGALGTEGVGLGPKLDKRIGKGSMEDVAFELTLKGEEDFAGQVHHESRE